MEKATKEFQKTISAMLEAEAVKDPLFAESLKKEGKSIDECCDYIIGHVKNSGCCGFADGEILSMAKHYYDEDNLGKIQKEQCRVVVNHTVELTEDEKAEAKREAMERLIEQEKKRMSEKPKKQPKPAQQAEVPQQGSLFD